MRIVVFGAAGGIGRHVVKIALDKGYEVVAVVRHHTSVLPVDNPALSVVVAKISEKEKIISVMKGCDAVINCIGVVMSPFKTDDAAVDATHQIIEYMNKTGVKRLITWSTPSVGSSEDVRSYITVLPGVMASIFLPKPKKAVLEIARQVQESGLDWTIVRFMAPKNSKPKGSVKISFGKDKLNFNISRVDIARFMVDQIGNNEYIHRMPIIGS